MISGIMLTMLLISMLTLAFDTQPVKASGTIYIRADGSVDPSTAPIQRDGNLYTFTANISELIVVQGNNIIVNGNDYVLQGTGDGKGFDLSSRRNVTIEKVCITGFDYGIYLRESTGNSIESNTITNCVYGILLDRSPNTTMRNNIITNNRWDGIFLTASDNSMIKNNTVMNHGKWGLYLGYSLGVTLRDNKIAGNRWNFGISVSFIHNIDDSNTLDGKPIYYWINQHDGQVPANAGYVAIINSLNITVKNLNLTKNGQGLVLVNSKKCLIENCLITKMGYYGIQLVNSDDNIIRTNNITDNKDGYFDVGIALQSYSTANTISNNLIKNNGQDILLHKSDNNTIYHNNFVNNTAQASSEGSTNIWDSGYPSGGNYWSDYTGVDGDGDGIGDTAYAKGLIIDRYPLMNPASGLEFLEEGIPLWMQWWLWSIIVAGIVVLAGAVYFLKKRKSSACQSATKETSR